MAIITPRSGGQRTREYIILWRTPCLEQLRTRYTLDSRSIGDAATKLILRGNGEGSLYFDKDKRRWVAEITIGDRKRRRRLAETKREARTLLAEMQRRHDLGVGTPEACELFAVFLNRSLDNQKAPNRLSQA